ncbi:hypothetical protein ACFQ4Q_06985 [Lysobacter gummosus]|uniref:hypothetical protein n=1 Tax=Lysobacter gummosus TaxID=262324 RepID=UPI00363084B0
MTAKSFLASALLSALVLAPGAAPAADSDPIIVPGSTANSQAYEGIYYQLLQRVVQVGTGSRTDSHIVISNDEAGCDSAVYDKRQQGWGYRQGQASGRCTKSYGAINEIRYKFSSNGERLPPDGTVSIMLVTRKPRPGERSPVQGLVASNDTTGCLAVVGRGQMSPNWSADMSGGICPEAPAILLVNGRVIGGR